MSSTTRENGKLIEEIRSQVIESNAVKEAIINSDNHLATIAEIAETVIACYRTRGKVIFMGNGGSAADAQHLACELVSKFNIKRKALTAIALSVNTSILTAIGNDYDFNQIFVRQIEAWVKPGDVVVGISTSGNSENIILAIERAKGMGATTVALTGESGGKIAPVADISFKAPSKSTPRIQEAHITAGHIICDIVERALFGKSPLKSFEPIDKDFEPKLRRIV